jgi:hypothetical protein
MLCISIILVVILLWYISKQEYSSSCDRKIMNMHYQAHIKEGDYPKLALSRHQGETSTCRTMLEKHRKTLDPEKNVMDEHSMGDSLHNTVKKIDDPLSLDGILQKQDETKDQQLHRSITENLDGKQLEGMSAPIEEFEEGSLNRQMILQQNIYGEQDVSVDQLSESNM